MTKDTKYYIGVDIGGTKCAVTLACLNNDELTFLDKTLFPTTTYKETFGSIVNAVEKYVEKESISSIGISCGSPLMLKKE